ncbi:antitermination protein Q [Phage NBSal002]|nr:antitermination protein Q [Phage NBSal002]
MSRFYEMKKALEECRCKDCHGGRQDDAEPGVFSVENGNVLHVKVLVSTLNMQFV